MSGGGRTPVPVSSLPEEARELVYAIEEENERKLQEQLAVQDWKLPLETLGLTDDVEV